MISVLFRLLLAVALVLQGLPSASAMADPAAHGVPHAVGQAAEAAAGGCHGDGEAAPAAPADGTGADCCAQGACGCECALAAALSRVPAALPGVPPAAAPGLPIATSHRPPALPDPIRPPIA